MSDMVNHPNHYISHNGLEVIDVIDEFTYGLEGYEAIYTGNVIKYICRWKQKNGLEDLKKARWYLDRLIDRIDTDESDYHSVEETVDIFIKNFCDLITGTKSNEKENN